MYINTEKKKKSIIVIIIERDETGNEFGSEGIIELSEGLMFNSSITELNLCCDIYLNKKK